MGGLRVNWSASWYHRGDGNCVGLQPRASGTGGSGVVCEPTHRRRGVGRVLAGLITAIRGQLNRVRVARRGEAFVEIWSGFSEAKAEQMAEALSICGIETRIAPFYPTVGEVAGVGGGFSVWVPRQHAGVARSVLKRKHLT